MANLTSILSRAAMSVNDPPDRARRERLGRLRRTLGAVLVLTPVLAVMAVWSASAAQSQPGVAPGFFGMNANGTLFAPHVNLNRQLTRMQKAGTGIIRFPIYWSTAQPYASWGAVPKAARKEFQTAGGRPTSFRTIDRQILAFAKHGLEMLPVVLQTPTWARLQVPDLWSAPAHAQDYGRFVGDLVARYGTHGQFWKQHRSLAGFAPRWWQIWNEPAGGTSPEAGSLFWDGPKPYEPLYIAMLRSAHAAARKADPNSRIVLGGLFGDSWDALAGIYNYGGRGLFDAVAVHPYADSPAHVLTILTYVHQVLQNEHATRLPLLVTETGWPSALNSPSEPGAGIYTTEAGQASELSAEYPLLVAHRRELNLQAIFWYSWIGSEPSLDPTDYAGLVRLTPQGQVKTKPALSAYTSTLRRLEHNDRAAAFTPQPGL